MNQPDLIARTAADFPEDDLLRLEIKVAQRADELSERHGRLKGRDLEHWLQAEREIIAVVGEDSGTIHPI